MQFPQPRDIRLGRYDVLLAFRHHLADVFKVFLGRRLGLALKCIKMGNGEPDAFLPDAVLAADILIAKEEPFGMLCVFAINLYLVPFAASV